MNTDVNILLLSIIVIVLLFNDAKYDQDLTLYNKDSSR